LLKDVLGRDLLGVYLYGSAIVGGLQRYSDIDIFVISNRQSTSEEKAQLENNLLKISGIYGVSKEVRPIEVTIVVKSEVNPWHYPPQFDFQYGDWLRKDFEAGKIEPWPTKEMPDLALLITQVLLASKILYGPAPNQLLEPVPYHDFIVATIKEIDNLMADLDHDTRNVLLTLARIWRTIETDTISSKPDAAAWAFDRLPEDYKPVMQRARSICLGEEPEYWEDISALLHPCAEFIVSQVKKQTALLESLSHANRTIRLNRQ
jgi:streptomycin 3"-adenylyltransferase